MKALNVLISIVRTPPRAATSSENGVLKAAFKNPSPVAVVGMLPVEAEVKFASAVTVKLENSAAGIPLKRTSSTPPV